MSENLRVILARLEQKLDDKCASDDEWRKQWLEQCAKHHAWTASMDKRVDACERFREKVETKVEDAKAVAGFTLKWGGPVLAAGVVVFKWLRKHNLI